MRRVYADTVFSAFVLSFIIHLIVATPDSPVSFVLFVLLVALGSGFPGHVSQKIKELEEE